MIFTDALPKLIGSTAYGPDGARLGTIGQIYLDNNSGSPEWATVKTGLFGTRESFVPLRDAQPAEDGIRFPFDRDRIKGAPNIDADGDLSPAEESALYEYYGPTVEHTAAERDRPIGTGYAEADRVDADRVDSSRATTSGYDTSGPTTDDAMTRSEERVRAGTERREAGRARLRKYVVTEHQQVSVPVTHEEVRVEREPITDANRDRAMAGPDLSEEEHEIVLTEERPVVQKETVPVERVRLSKDQVSEEQNVGVDVRSEHIETDVDAGIESRTDRR